MWSNYMLTTYRTFLRNKFFVGINLLSISIAFSLCTIAYFNIQFNSDFNTYFEKADTILKVNTLKNTQEGLKIQSNSPIALKTYLDADYPEIVSSRFHALREVIRIEDRKFRESVAYVDDTFFQLFSFVTINGIKPAFVNEREVYISEALAYRYFGSLKIGQEMIQLQLPDKSYATFMIKGVIKDAPENTSFKFDLITPFTNYENIHNMDLGDWSKWVNGTFLSSPTMTEEAMTQSVNKYLELQEEASQVSNIEGYEIDSILEWPAYESSSLNSSFMGYLHPASVMGTVSSAVAVLLLAIFNFVNTSLAIARKRMKEIGMRKVLGGKKRDIRIQFLLESLLQILIALVASGLITMLLTDAYNAMFEFEIVEFERVNLIPFMLLFMFVWLVTGVLAGLYPAFYISKFQSLKIIKGRLKLGNKNVFTRTLLTLQLAVCIYNVFSLIVFSQNAMYQETLDRGYKPDQSINIPINSKEQFQTLKSEIGSSSLVDRVSGTVNAIGFSAPDHTLTYQQREYDVVALEVGEDYLQALGIRLSSGRFFDKSDIDQGKSAIINSLLSKSLGENVLNRWVYLENERYQIVGIVDDFNLRPIMLDNKIKPTIITSAKEESYQYVHVSASNDVIACEEYVKLKWAELFPEELYSGFMQEEVMKNVRQTNKITISINSFVAVLTLLITSLGLYAMVCLNIQSRIKELGIRKVLGATVSQIMHSINKPVYLMLMIAIIAGLILGQVVISHILDIIYAYHREIQLVNFVWPIFIVTLLLVLSIGLKVYQSARTNPVEQLRTE